MVVTWIYGIQKFVDNIQEMGMRRGLGRPYGWFRIMLTILLAVVTPILLIAVCIIAWMQREDIIYGGEKFPPVAEGFGWVMELGPLIFVLIIPVWQVYKWSRDNMSIGEIWEKLLKPSESWYEVERDIDVKVRKNEEFPQEYGQENMGYRNE